MELWQKILVVVAAACTVLLFESGLDTPRGDAVSHGENRGAALNEREKDIYVSLGGFFDGRLVVFILGLHPGSKISVPLLFLKAPLLS